MDLRYGDEYEAFRDELRAFVAKAAPSPGEASDEPLAAFRAGAIERGYAYRGIPREFGGSGAEPDALKEAIVGEEFARVDVHRAFAGARESMIAHTLLDLGSEEQKREFIAPTLRCEILWCQGYSEPGAGSDLASLRSRGQLDGDEWVLNGHKVWTSGALESHWMFGLFRTEPEASKHAGISYLLVPMRQPGIEVRPLRQMDGGGDFNEVFFENARTAAGNIVGKRGEGWQVSRATLKHERNIIGNPNLMRDRFAALLKLARESERNGRPALADTSVRQRLGEIEARMRVADTARMRMLTAEAKGDPIGAGLWPLMAKLYATDTEARIVELAYDLVGSDGLLAAPIRPQGPDVRSKQDWVRQYISSLGTRLGGGSSNIQRNIIGERGLGLPRDPRPAK